MMMNANRNVNVTASGSGNVNVNLNVNVRRDTYHNFSELGDYSSIVRKKAKGTSSFSDAKGFISKGDFLGTIYTRQFKNTINPIQNNYITCNCLYSSQFNK
jgi:hypothetical protein